jgi:hypothetical protein
MGNRALQFFFHHAGTALYACIMNGLAGIADGVPAQKIRFFNQFDPDVQIGEFNRRRKTGNAPADNQDTFTPHLEKHSFIIVKALKGIPYHKSRLKNSLIHQITGITGSIKGIFDFPDFPYLPDKVGPRIKGHFSWSPSGRRRLGALGF